MKINLFDIPNVESGKEEITVLYEDKSTRIERIVSNEASSPEGFWYEQADDEWVSILAGEAVLAIDEKIINLAAGDSILLPAYQRHRVVSTSTQCIWLCVFSKKKGIS